jgi:putative Mg2+ transporter-C (MgtC) family protein
MSIEWEILLRLAISALLGCLIGMERERRVWAAGLRTHMLVAVGATLFMLVSIFGFRDAETSPTVMLDPSRVASQVVSGIGFLGAGTILLRRDTIRGLTTAASLWMVAAIGLAVGGGLYLAASMATVLALVILALLKPLEKRLFASRRPQHLTVHLKRDQTSLLELDNALRKADLDLLQVQSRYDKEQEEIEVEIAFTSSRPMELLTVIDSLRELPGLREISHDR